MGICFGIALLASIITAAAPAPARAEFVSPTLICCCDVDRVTCVDSPLMQGQMNPDGAICPPVGAENAAYTEKTTPVERGTSGKNLCSDFANPNGAAQRAEADKEVSERTWVKWILCPSGVGENCELVPANCRGDQRNDSLKKSPPCTINDMLLVLVNVTKLMLALLGTAAFLMFVYGGVVFLTSAGNQERVTSGRRILTNAVLGILVVLVSWTVINFVVAAISLGRTGVGELGNVFETKWNRGP